MQSTRFAGRWEIASGPDGRTADRFPRNRERDITAADISRDGKYVAFIPEKLGRRSLWLKQPIADREILLAGPTDECLDGVAFSAADASLYFTRRPRNSPDGALYRVPLLGGDPELVLRGVSGPPAISPDRGRAAFAATHG